MQIVPSIVLMHRKQHCNSAQGNVIFWADPKDGFCLDFIYNANSYLFPYEHKNSFILENIWHLK